MEDITRFIAGYSLAENLCAKKNQNENDSDEPNFMILQSLFIHSPWREQIVVHHCCDDMEHCLVIDKYKIELRQIRCQIKTKFLYRFLEKTFTINGLNHYFPDQLKRFSKLLDIIGKGIERGTGNVFEVKKIDESH